MRIACHHHGAGNDIALFHHHLMRDAGARRIKIDAVLASELFDVGVLLQIFRRDVLNIVIDGEHWLRRVRDRGGADLLELWDHRAGVVMRHDVTRPNRDKVATPHHRIRGEPVRVARSDFLDEREAHISYSALISFRGVVGQARRLPVSETQASGALALQFIKDCIHHFFAARLPSSLAISKSTKSAWWKMIDSIERSTLSPSWLCVAMMCRTSPGMPCLYASATPLKGWRTCCPNFP